MKVTAHGLTDRGKRREKNEDAFAVDADQKVFVVADGVGGKQFGEVAAKIFADTIRDRGPRLHQLCTAACRLGEQGMRQALFDAMQRLFDEASARIWDYSANDLQYRGMCTTGTVLVFLDCGEWGQAAVLGHVGDSRAYLVRGGKVCRLTKDHSVAQQMLDEGLLSQEDFLRTPLRRVLARVVGRSPSVKVDTAWLDVMPGDSYVLCSDGLTGHVSDDEILELAQQYNGYPLTARLVDTANERGGVDNITVISVKVAGDAPADDVIEATKRIAFLSDVGLFKPLNNQELVSLLKVVFQEERKVGEVVVTEGNPGRDMYIVADGLLEVVKGGRVLTSVRPGEQFGELALFDHAPRSATVRAVRPSTLFRIPSDAFSQLMRSDPVIARKVLWSLMEYAAKRIRDLSDRLTQRSGEAHVSEDLPDEEPPPMPPEGEDPALAGRTVQTRRPRTTWGGAMGTVESRPGHDEEG